MFDSATFNALNSALDGLAARQRAIADNIANVNTPDYQASRVQFEDALARSIATGDGRVEPTVHVSLEPTRADGSNVNLDTETTSNIDTVLRHQFASQAIGGEFSGIRTAIKF